MSKKKKAKAWTQSHVRNPINSTLRSKVNILLELWMYLTHPLIVIDPCAKYGMPMSNLTEVTSRTWRHIWQKPINLTLRNRIGNIIVRVTSSHGDPYPKYGKPLSNKKIVMGGIQKHVKNTSNLTMRSKFKVVSGSWMYETRHLVVIHPCANFVHGGITKGQ